MKRPAVIAAFAVMALSLAITGYRVFLLGYPALPATPDYVWTFRFDGSVHATGKDTLFLLSLPSQEHGQIILEESIDPGSMSFNLLKEYDNRIGVWSGKLDEGQYISYKASILLQHRGTESPAIPPRSSYPYGVSPEDVSRVEESTRGWRAISFPARVQAMLDILRNGNIDPAREPDIARILEVIDKYDRTTRLLILFASVNIPARAVEGLILREEVTDKTVRWVSIWTGQRWDHVDMVRLRLYPAKTDLMPLSVGGMSAIRISGGELATGRFELKRDIMSRWNIFFERINRSNRILDRWSLFRIPPEYQTTFRILLLVPLGALLIAVLRNIVGFQTFGIFMPVLMALAFRNTGLFYGLAMFAGIILIGYAARRFLNRLRLLLIPRMSVLVTLVILCFVVLALAGNKLGIRQFMAVGLLPFVILTMTIERFFVVVEEHGLKTALQTALGSALVSVIAYLILQWEILQITFFVYPELLLFVMGLEILVGRYTGYRLSELIRFRSFGGHP